MIVSFRCILQGFRMLKTTCFLVLTLALASPAIAQPTSSGDSSECEAQATAIERDMTVARSKGQMLRRGQLAEELAALQARCDVAHAERGRAARMGRLEQEIQDLRGKLKRAEEELHNLENESH